MSRATVLVAAVLLVWVALLYGALRATVNATSYPPGTVNCDLYPEAHEPAQCARDHWAN